VFIFRFRMGDCGELEKSRGYSDNQIGRILRIAGEHEAEWLAECEKRCGSN